MMVMMMMMMTDAGGGGMVRQSVQFQMGVPSLAVVLVDQHVFSCEFCCCRCGAVWWIHGFHAHSS